MDYSCGHSGWSGGATACGARAWQVLLRFDPDGSRTRVYTKHSTAGAVAFERPGWEPISALPTLELAGATAGATICHDQYLGLLPRALAAHGARLWVNPSFDNVTDIKWSSILRLRAMENRFFSLCTLHCDVSGHRTHPFGFSPDGAELRARQPGSDTARPLSECCEVVGAGSLTARTGVAQGTQPGFGVSPRAI